MLNTKLKKLFGIIKSICNHFNGGRKTDISLLNEKFTNNEYVRLASNQELGEFILVTTVIEIKENGQLVINAGKDRGVFKGLSFNIKHGTCLVVSADKETCIAEMQPQKRKHICVFSGVTILTPFYPHIKIGDIVWYKAWRVL